MTLEEIIVNKKLGLIHNKFGTDKFELKSYIKYYYESRFKIFKNKEIKILEIGVRNGFSLILWEEYFKRAQIYGVDDYSDVGIDQEKLIDLGRYERIKLIRGDAYSDDLINNINEEFEIIIDDGPHDLNSQIIFIKKYTKKLKCDGLMVIEDILAGGCSIIPLMLALPIGFNGRFYDFRFKKFKSDNCIFEIKRNSKYIENIVNRLNLFTIGICYLLLEGVVRTVKNRVKKF